MMAWLESFSFIDALVSLTLSVILSAVAFTARNVVASAAGRFSWMSHMATGMAGAGLAFLTLSLASRAAITGHGPFSNMYEFSISFSWGILAVSLLFQWRYRTSAVRNIATLVAIGLLVFANSLSSKPAPLVPALQQGFLLSAHVTAAVIAYGAFAVGFGSAVLYLLQTRYQLAWLPQEEVLEIMSHQSVVIGFPFMTLAIVLGALWADVAWGRYWGWDPKETASLVTWLLYAGYLHARIVRSWKGVKAAVLLIAGFGAVIFTFLGNYVFSGLHSYL